MAVDAQYLKNIAPELSKETDDRLLFFIQRAVDQLPPSAWGNKLDWATGLYACHLITVMNRKGNGMTSMEKVGDVQRQYDTPKSGSDYKNFLATTSYGQQLWQLIKTRVTTPYIAGDGGNNNPGGLSGAF